jgi:peptidoglycan-N-acetylglucosamine deacetylase
MPWLLRASLAWHGLALAGVLARPDLWLWAVGAVVANHGLLSLATLWPTGDWLGPNVTRLPPRSVARREVALTIDDGPNPEVTPQVLDLLDAAGVQATFFCIAQAVAKHPALAREIVQRGHELQNHSAAHRHTFSLLGPAGYAREVARAQQLITDNTGARPRYFRAPAGFRNCFLDPVLHRLNLRLVSWTRRGFDTRNGEPGPVLARLCRGLAAGDILLLHDGHVGHTPEGQPLILAVLPSLLARCAAAGLRPVRLSDALAPRAVSLNPFPQETA